MSTCESFGMKEQIREYLAKTFHDMGAVRDDESLFEKGVLDSLAFLQLLGFIEQRFKITFHVTEIAIDNFDSLDKIVGLIERKRNASRK